MRSNNNLMRAVAGLLAGAGMLPGGRTPTGHDPLTGQPVGRIPTRSTYDPNRLRDHQRRHADATAKRQRRMERNLRLLAAGAVEPVRGRS